jgi:hypothetical protein
MSPNLSTNLQVEKLTASLPALQKKLSPKRPSLFGLDKDKIIIGKKFNEPLTGFEDYI